MRVLVIDDHALFRIGLQELLERRGIDVIAIGDCLKGIETVAHERPDVVLLDMRMPHMTRTEVLSVLRQHYPQMP
ncbi:MAG: response regulator, partial [Candidatus Thiodiazotropha taylori]